MTELASTLGTELVIALYFAFVSIMDNTFKGKSSAILIWVIATMTPLFLVYGFDYSILFFVTVSVWFRFIVLEIDKLSDRISMQLLWVTIVFFTLLSVANKTIVQ